MLLTMKCACGKLLDVDDEQLGQPAECPWCGNRFTAGAAVHSTTAVQAEEPTPKIVEREAMPPEQKKLEKSAIIDLTHPWVIPPAVWILIFGVLGCGVLLVGLCYFGMGAIGGGENLQSTAHFQTKILTQACEAYRVKHDRLPQNLAELLEKDALGGPYLESPDALIDPWGNRYQYDPKGPRNNGLKPDIWTVTPGGVEIGNWPRGR
jgi:hypothetical protein